ncbi:NAD(P)-dependent glycerol-3-phosphate dehydrogenase [bacterium]|nr:NAD(P)-dependent glycerol-3-phosphate dehydrogenase [bacterium]
MRIGLLGGGSWGTTLAKVLGEKGHDVIIWAYEDEVVKTINEENENKLFLPDFKLPATITATNSLKEAVKNIDMLVNVVPSTFVRSIFNEIKEDIPLYIPIVSATKGIEADTSFLISEILEDVLHEKYHYYLSFLSGPSFAKEVASLHPTLVTVASINTKLAKHVQEIFATNYFRTYTTNDVTGVEVGGALKNVIAIGAGVVSGLGYGTNTTSALITRGLAEMTRFAISRGANPLTLSGLSGLGDLVLTCSSSLSRNWSVGYRLGCGESLTDILKSMRMIAEGVQNSKSAYLAAKKINVEMPIFTTIYRVLYENLSIADAGDYLMGRSLKQEIY